jgi:hypothetical protein
MLRRALWCVLLVVLAFSSSVSAAEPARVSVLLLGDVTGHHRPEVFAQVLTPPLKSAGIDVTFTRNIKDISAANLAKYDCLAIYGDNGDLPADAEAAMIGYVEAGHGLAAIHCASNIFRNSTRYTALLGGRFWKHDTGVFRTRIIDAQHPAMRGVTTFESWDETYVHNELSDDRQVLMVRLHAGGYEPWTWVRQQGKGRVYYTASGHDERTWKQPGYVTMLAAGMRWAAGRTNDDSPPLKYQESAVGLPNYQPKQGWGKEAKRINRVQEPLSPADSIAHMHLPAGFHAELFAAEPDIVKPICMTFDERGRLWIAESTDYPNKLEKNPQREGNDRIVICDDPGHTGHATRFHVFADHLNQPTGLVRVRGGMIAVTTPHITFLKDAPGHNDDDETAGERQILLTGLGRGDTHGVASNLHYGLDNWIYGSVGYDGGNVKAGGVEHHFRQGYFRFRPDGSAFEPLTQTSNNTWGLGLSEAGDVFGSTANGEHAVHLAIPDRFFEGVRGWSGHGSIGIADHKEAHPVTDDVHQVDNFGGYTAAAGFELYTARSFPQDYWDRAAFVCEPTEHLVHLDWLVPQGSAFIARDGFNLMASSDAWTAPIAAQVGPDGAVWVIDWYTPIVQHNPTPEGFKTGAGAAYETPLRDKKHGRIYRIVADDAKPVAYPKLDSANPQTLIDALRNDNLLWRLQAQRMIVERGGTDMLRPLADFLGEHPESRAVPHALYALKGLGLFTSENLNAELAMVFGLIDKSAAVRRAALHCLPRDSQSVEKILRAQMLSVEEPLVRRDALLALAEMPGTAKSSTAIVAMLCEQRNYEDRWMPLAATAAAAADAPDFLIAAAAAPLKPEYKTQLADAIRAVAEHFARNESHNQIAPVLAALAGGNPEWSHAALTGLLAGWPANKAPEISPAMLDALSKLLAAQNPEGRMQVVTLGKRWKAGAKFDAAARDMKKTLLAQVVDAKHPDAARLTAARQLVSVGLDDDTVVELLGAITPKSSPELVTGVLEAASGSKSAAVGPAIIEHWRELTDTTRPTAVAILLSRPQWAGALLDGLDKDRVALTDLSLDQSQKLSQSADALLAEKAKKIFARGGKLPSADRQRVVDQFHSVADRRGDASRGRTVFEQNCAKCHRHDTLGAKIGPDLTGLAARKKSEILIDVLDPNRSVEGNYQQYNLTTEDGRTYVGLLSGDNRTSVELLDAEGKRHVVLRENIDSLVNTRRSLMPDGFEKLGAENLTDLLEFLTSRGKFVPLPLEKVATITSVQGMFFDRRSDAERLVFPDWDPKTAFGVPFHLTDPHEGRVANVIMLYSPQGTIPPTMPKSVTLPCNMPAKAIHLLSGVSGWGYPSSRGHTVSMIVRLHYADGKTEDIPLENAEHFADYIRHVDVPGSKLAFMLRGRQIRYLSVTPQRRDTIASIEFVKGPDATAPIVMAVTVETAE